MAGLLFCLFNPHEFEADKAMIKGEKDLKHTSHFLNMDEGRSTTSIDCSNRNVTEVAAGIAANVCLAFKLVSVMV